MVNNKLKGRSNVYINNQVFVLSVKVIKTEEFKLPPWS